MLKINSYSILIIIGSILPIVAFGVVGYLSYTNIENQITDESWVQHTHQVIEQLDAIEKSMLDVETGTRGYVITGDPVSLGPFNSGISQINSQLDSIRTLTADNPIQQSNIEKLTLLVEEKITFSNETKLLRDSSASAAVIHAQTLEGVKIMDNIRQLIVSMKSTEQGLLDQRNHDAQLAATYTKSAIIFGTISSIVIAIITTLVINKKLTERQRLEKSNIELQIRTQELRDTDIAKEEFTTMISHELKTPLVTISGYAEMLREDNGVLGPLNDEQIKAVEKISIETSKLERLISDIMDAQKIDLERMKFNKKEFSVDEFLDEQTQIHSKLMNNKKIRFINTTTEKISITSDPQRLSQVFANLIKNAADFVSLNQGLIEINAQSTDNQVTFYVKDNGSGIPKEKQAELFKKFYQVDTSLKRSHGGTGLGLVICKGIVEALGGKIWLESEVGKGTTFFFTIPKNDTSENPEN